MLLSVILKIIILCHVFGASQVPRIVPLAAVLDSMILEHLAVFLARGLWRVASSSRVRDGTRLPSASHVFLILPAGLLC